MWKWIDVLALRSVHCLIFAAAMLLLIEASTAQIGESISSDQQSNSIICNDNYLVNSYYLIPNKDIQSVAGFYNRAGPLLFLDTHIFSLYKVGRNRVDTYFDTQNLSLLGQKKELLISLDIDLPAYRLGKEQIISIDGASLPLRITKYESKSYNRKLSSLDKHPLFGKVKRKERQTLMSSIGDDQSTPPEGIISVLTVDHEEVVYSVRHFEQPLANTTLDSFSISNLGVQNSYFLLKLEFSQKGLSQLTSDERNKVNQAFCETRISFELRFPDIKRRMWFGYRDYDQLANMASPGRIYFNQYPGVTKLGHIAILLFLGVLAISLPWSRYSKPIVFRMLTKHTCHDDVSNQL